MGATIRIKVTHGLLMHGQAIAAGTVLALDVLAAADAVGSGRAVLADPADAPRVQAAVGEDSNRLLGKLGAAERQRQAAGWVTTGNFAGFGGGDGRL